MGEKYTVGVDFGTESARAILLDLESGEVAAEAEKRYPHGVLDKVLPDGTVLPPDWALEHPGDWVEAMGEIVPAVLRNSGVSPEKVIALGLDFTACTVMPVDRAGTPLCLKAEYEHDPHAWPKLWKHHGGQAQAERITRLIEERGETFLDRYGGRVSSEWLLPKIAQTVEEAPEIYDAAYRFTEAGDWMVFLLTGKETRGSCAAGYKAFWHKREGVPSPEFMKAIHPKLEHFYEEKLTGNILPQGSPAGEMTEAGAQLTGLLPGTVVAAAGVDAHAAMPAAGIGEPGTVLMIIGTSTCHLALGREEKVVPGICGVVEDGVLPGYYGYEAGQTCVGDQFAWFVKNCVPPEYFAEAEKHKMNIHQYLTEKASRLRPGESGLMALDWWNGNRSILADADLTGLMLGMTLTTKPEEMYRALLESTAYGTRRILDNFTENGVPVRRLRACGGIAKKNPLMMQIYADVTGKEISVVPSDQAPALGSALFAAAAAGKERGGFGSITEATERFGGAEDGSYRPIEENRKTYEALYREFVTLHDYFGRGGNDVMKRLKTIKLEAGNNAG